MRESKIEGYLRTEIAKLGGVAEKFVSPGKKGPPDQLVSWPGRTGVGERFIYGAMYKGIPAVEFIETKAPKKGPTVLQRRDHMRRRMDDFQVHVISTMEQAEEYLRSRGKK